MLASCYLLFRQGNAFAKDVTPPIRLRRWTAAFFAVFVVNHVWYMWPTFFLTSGDDVMLANLVGGLFDCMTFFPLSIIILLVMLQDRRRPLWPVAVMVAPLIVGMMWCIASSSRTIFPMLIAYLLLMSIGLIIYMVRALRQYGRWLRDNYADLEHKEVWQSFVVLAIIVLVFAIYALTGGDLAYEYILQVVVILLICYLLWRVETLSDLNIPQPQSLPADETTTEVIGGDSFLPLDHCCSSIALTSSSTYSTTSPFSNLPRLLELTVTISASIFLIRARLTMPTSMICVSTILSVSITRLSIPSVPSLPSSWPWRVVTAVTIHLEMLSNARRDSR